MDIACDHDRDKPCHHWPEEPLPTLKRPDPGVAERKDWPPADECPYVEVTRTSRGWTLIRYAKPGAPPNPFRCTARTRWGARRKAKRWIHDQVRRRYQGETFTVRG